MTAALHLVASDVITAKARVKVLMLLVHSQQCYCKVKALDDQCLKCRPPEEGELEKDSPHLHGSFLRYRALLQVLRQEA